ncbi:hypothetical protein B296_00034360 [Ensete ventricosum]|uniref:Uncharacterized protein n=1 Tax=Ensete ventricosum TaxID=4639 RepID=A0A426WZY6_ENSVE|nr:hypothetical protein B296_00034360 [Ensete ventricosum]
MLAGNTLGDRRKKTIELTARMPEVARLSGNRPYPGIRVTANGYQRLNRSGLVGKPLVPSFRAVESG